jgi:hypothetical protein
MGYPVARLPPIAIGTFLYSYLLPQVEHKSQGLSSAVEIQPGYLCQGRGWARNETRMGDSTDPVIFSEPWTVLGTLPASRFIWVE